MDCILHAGGALADAMIGQQSLRGIRTVFAAKVRLHPQHSRKIFWSWSGYERGLTIPSGRHRIAVSLERSPLL